MPRLELAPRLLELHRVRARRALLELREGAEEARGDADVGDLEAHVAVEVRAVAVEPLAHLVGELTDGDDVGVAEERDARRRTSGARRARTLSRIGVEAHGASSCGRFASCALGSVGSTNTATRPARLTKPASSRCLTTCADSSSLFFPRPLLAVGDRQAALGRDAARRARWRRSRARPARARGRSSSSRRGRARRGGR